MSKRSKKSAPTAPPDGPAASGQGGAREAAALAQPDAVAEVPATPGPTPAEAPPAPDVTDEALEEAAQAAALGSEQDDPVPEGTDEPPRKERKRSRASVPPPPPERLVGAVEALLLAAGDVLTAERLRDVLGMASAIHVREAVEEVRRRWAAAGLSVELQEVAGGVRVVTRPEYAEYVRRLQRHVVDGKLSQGLLETLSIVAYRQPVARPEIERIRGVQVGEALRALLERNLVKVVGRSDQPGRPMLYGTTKRFLTAFGLNDVKDLPSAKDLARL
jgi:segregation and condensation protein B